MRRNVTIADAKARAIENVTHWQLSPINVYHTALTNAHDRFKATIKKQDEVDNMQAEILFLIGFVIAGSLVTAAVGAGTAAAGAYFSNKAIGGRFTKWVSRVKLPSTVNGLTTFANTGLLSSLRSNMASEIQVFGKTVGKNMSHKGGGATAMRPNTVADIKSVLLLDLDDTYKEILDICHAVDNSSLSEADKSICAKWLMKHPFMVDSVPDIRTFQREIEVAVELTLLFDHILKMDKMVTVAHVRSYEHPGPSDLTTEIKSTPITGSYKAGTYPTPKSEPQSDFYTTQYVGYTDPGNTVARSINALLKESKAFSGDPSFMVDDNWFINGLGKQQIVAAENYLIKLMNIPAVKQAGSFM